MDLNLLAQDLSYQLTLASEQHLPFTLTIGKKNNLFF